MKKTHKLGYISPYDYNKKWLKWTNTESLTSEISIYKKKHCSDYIKVNITIREI